MRKIIFTTIAVLIICGNSFGQITFQKAYGYGITDYVNFIQQTTDGGYIMAGYTESFDNGDIYLIKTNAFGDTLWTKAYGSFETEYVGCVRQTNDGGYIIAGGSEQSSEFQDDVYIVKTDSVGDTIWAKIYLGGDASSIQQTTDGGYIIFGGTSCDMCNPHFLLIKTFASGDTIWTRTFQSSDDDMASSVQQTSDGGYILVGTSRYYFPDAEHVQLIKTNANGDTLWTKSYGGSNFDYGSSVQQTTDGGYIIAGGTSSFGVGNGDVYLIKTNSTGDVLWSLAYGGPRGDGASSVQQTTDGGFIIAGSTSSFADTVGDVYLIKTNSVGDTLWTRTYGGSNADEASSVQQTTDGGYIIAGFTRSFGAGGSDLYLIKTDSIGNTECDAGSTSTFISIAVTQTFPSTVGISSGLTVEPTQTLIHRGTVVTTICSDEGIPSISQSQSSTLLFPNPISQSSTLQINSSLQGNVTVNIYNILGQNIMTKESNSHTIYLSSNDFSEGIYFYRAMIGDTIIGDGKFVVE